MANRFNTPLSKDKDNGKEILDVNGIIVAEVFTKDNLIDFMILCCNKHTKLRERSNLCIELQKEKKKWDMVKKHNKALETHIFNLIQDIIELQKKVGLLRVQND